MSVISQAAIVLMIILTALIISLANRGLKKADQLGEHFVDEWALKLQKEDELKRNRVRMQREEEMRNRRVRRKPGPSERSLNPAAEPAAGQGNVVPMPERRRESTPAAGAVSSVIKINNPIRLTVLDEEKNVVKVADVDHYPYSIGRDPSNDLVLGDIYIARKHCVISEAEGMPVLINKGSQNKIYADGKHVDRYPLKDRSHFFLGAYELFVTEQKDRSQPAVTTSERERILI